MAQRTTKLFVIAVALLALTFAFGCSKPAEKAAEPAATEQSTTAPTTTETPATEAPAATGPKAKDVTELKIEDTKVGKGTEAKAGKAVTVHYTGYLTDGTKFDSSVDRGEPFTFNLGGGEVIQGWDEGVAGMKIGGKRKLTIPPSMGYGDAGAGGVIPGGATLVFDVELLEVK